MTGGTGAAIAEPTTDAGVGSASAGCVSCMTAFGGTKGVQVPGLKVEND